MADIFLSWGSPDAKVVGVLKERLADLGLSFFEYSHDMAAGDEIPVRVLDEIHRASLALLCLSDETVGREWLRRELDWCYADYKDPQRPLKALVVVQVGPLDRARVPQLVQDSDLFVYDLSAPDAQLQRLVENVREKLGQSAPVVLRAALFAMTRAEAEGLFAHADACDAVVAVCRAVGMPDPPALFTELRERYGPQAHDFAPFRSDTPLVALVQSVVRAANRARADTGAPPLFLRWMEQDFAAAQPEERRRARDAWRSGGSLLVVDSISTLHETIRNRLRDLPVPDDPEQAGVLWIPPHSQQTADIAAAIQVVAEAVDRLGDACRDWPTRPERCLAFDIGTPEALQQWLHWTLRRLVGEARPLRENVAAFRSAVRTPPMRPQGFFSPLAGGALG